MSMNMHGANYEALYRMKNITMPGKVYDLSSNTNVLKGPVDMTTILNETCLKTYPDPNCESLCQALQEKIGCNQEELLMTNGANEAIYLIASLLSGKKVGIIHPAYPEYEKAVRAFGGEIIDIDTIQEHNRQAFFRNRMTMDMTIKMEAIVRCDAVFLSNPNNPTGQLLPKAFLQELIHVCQSNGVMCVVDESYMDFVDGHETYWEGLYDLEMNRQLYIVRSMTKIYSVPGLRIGYIISSSENIDKLKKRQPTWSVNGMAQRVGVALLKEKGFIKQTVDFYKSERKRVLRLLSENCIQAIDSDTNFLIIGMENASDCIDFLLEQGIAVRHTNNHKGIDGKGIRIAIGEESINNRLLREIIRWRDSVI